MGGRLSGDIPEPSPKLRFSPWERLTGADRIEMRELRTPAGAVAYFVGHHHKNEQAPPHGWSGKRFRPSRRYFSRPVAELGAQARADRAVQIRMLKLIEDVKEQGLDPDAINDVLWEYIDEHAPTPPPPPQLVEVRQSRRGVLWDRTNERPIKVKG